MPKIHRVKSWRILNRREFVLVTGVAGFIGSHLAEELLRQGVPVLGIDNFDPFYDRGIKERNLEGIRQAALDSGTPFDFSETDICDLGAKSFADHRIESIIHLAAKAGVRPSLLDPQGYLKTNVEGTLKVLEFAKIRGIKKILFGSSSSVYGDDTPVPFRETAVADRPISPYAATKRAGELYCSTYAHLHGMSIAALRFFTVYGPRQRPDLAIHKFAKQIAGGETVTLYGDGSTERDYTFVSDIVQGIVGAREWVSRVPEGTYEVFNLGGSATTSLSDLVGLIEKGLGIGAKIKREPMQLGDVQRTYADVSRAREAFGYRPTTPIRTGIVAFLNWFKNESGLSQPKRKAA